MDVDRVEPVTVKYQECEAERAADSSVAFHLELTCDDEPLVS